MPDIKQFTHKYLSESMMILALIVAGFSAWKSLLFGGIGVTLAFLVIGAILSVFFPVQMDNVLKHFYQLGFKRHKISEVIVGVCTIAIALVFPFIFFGIIGLLAGSAYHYFINYAQKSNNSKGHRAA